jgi:serine/threonine protein kinase
MTPDNWHKIEAVLQDALDLPQQQRGAFVAEACSGDEVLEREVISLVDAFDRSGDFIEAPALASDAEVLLTIGDNNIGRVVGPYQIVERLGVGGMGEVYKAKDQRLDRVVALKILPIYLSDELRLSRFRKEARAVSALNHPNIITIHEVGDYEDVRYIATEFIEGDTLRDLISRNQLSADESLGIAEQICGALSVAHEAGIIHRDIKPENVMRRPDGIVKLLDFGIAKLTEPAPSVSSSSHTQTELGVIMGTVNYMSPEQARGLHVDERSDIWSLGVLLYEMLTGRLPFNQSTRLDTMVAILERDPAPLSDSPAYLPVSRMIQRCLAKDVDARYQSAMQLLDEVRLVRSQLSKDIPPITETTSYLEHSTVIFPTPKKRFRILIVAALVLLIAAPALFLYRTWINRTPAVVVTSSFKLYSDMSEPERLLFIDQQEQRVSALLGEHTARLPPAALNAIKQKVDEYVQRQNSTKTDRDNLSVIFQRAQLYLPTIGRSFRERNVPLIIGVYLPLVESEYRVCYESAYGSKGLYQFAPRTALQYGLAPNEMCDAEKMAPAAAHYLADRIAELGDDSQSLTLVVLSYTTGAEWVRETLRNLRANGNYDRNFWTIFANRDLLGRSFTNEAADYVPRFFAGAIIGENPAHFGLATRPLSELANEQASPQP